MGVTTQDRTEKRLPPRHRVMQHQFKDGLRMSRDAVAYRFVGGFSRFPYDDRCVAKVWLATWIAVEPGRGAQQVDPSRPQTQTG